MNEHNTAGRADRSSRAVSADDIQSYVTATRIRGLDFLRAIAVLFVILGHATESRLPFISVIAYLGVKIFFVLSGFLITGLLLEEYSRRSHIGFLNFYRRRIARLMPVFYLFLAMGIATLWLHHRPIPWTPVLSSVLYVTNYYQAFTGAKASLVSHCWSLAVEEQFYLLWPMILLFLLRRQLSLIRALAIGAVFVWCWRWFLLGVIGAPDAYLYNALDTRADDLIWGCLLAVLVRSPLWRGRLAFALRTPLIGTAAVLALGVAVFYHPSNLVQRYGIAFAVEPPIIALLLLHVVTMSNQHGWAGSILNNRFLVHIGQISYGMYLFHGLIGYTTERIFEQRVGSFPVALIAECAAVIAFASASFRWFETPLRHWVGGSHGTGRASRWRGENPIARAG